MHKAERINFNERPQPGLSIISEISKRAYQLALTTNGIGVLIFTYYCLLGLYLTALMVALFCFGIGFLSYLNYKAVISNTKLPIILFSSVCLIVFAAKEGFGAGQYLYFFSLS